MTQRENVYVRPQRHITDIDKPGGNPGQKKPAGNGHRFGPQLICGGENGCDTSYDDYQDAPDLWNHQDRLAAKREQAEEDAA